MTSGGQTLFTQYSRSKYAFICLFLYTFLLAWVCPYSALLASPLNEQRGVGTHTALKERSQPLKSASSSNSSTPPADAIEEGDASYADRRESVINEMRWLSQHLRQIRLRLDPTLPLRAREVAERVQQAQLDLISAQSIEVVLNLFAILQRAQIERSPSYAQLLTTFGISLLQNGLIKMGISQFDRALKVERVLPSQYERVLLEYFERSRGEVPLKRLQTLWSTYIQLCAQVKRPPSSKAVYGYGKSLYFAQAFPNARRQMNALINSKHLALRSRYFIAMIALKEQNISEAQEGFKALEPVLLKRGLSASTIKPTSPAVKPSTSTPTLNGPPGRVIKSMGRLTISQVDRSSLDHSQKSSKSDDLLGSEGLPDDLQQMIDHMDRDVGMPLVGMRASGGDLRRPAPSERGVHYLTLKSALHLTLARLSILEGDFDEAWQRYRLIPLGLPYGSEALLESTYVLRAQYKYLQCIAILDQMLAFNSDDASSYQLRLWKAEMYVKAGLPEKSRDVYRQLKSMISRELRAVSTSDKLLFAPEVLAWVEPQQARQARTLGRKVKQQEIALRQAQFDWNALYEAHKQRRYPTLIEGDRFIQRVTQRMNHLKARVTRLSSIWSKWDQERSTNDRLKMNRSERDPLFKDVSGAQILKSLNRLNTRVPMVSALLDQARETIPRKLPKMLKREREKLLLIEGGIQDLRQKLKVLSQSLRTAALERLKAYEAKIVLGPINLVFWKKELESDILDQLRMGRLNRLNQIKGLSIQQQSAAHSPLILDELIPYVEQLLTN